MPRRRDERMHHGRNLGFLEIDRVMAHWHIPLGGRRAGPAEVGAGSKPSQKEPPPPVGGGG
jgi:hypothetical protein